MTEPSTLSQDPRHFSAVLTPHRALGPRGFMVLMTLVCIVSFATGLMFYMLGAWPVVGFLGLDVALIYVAFTLNFRALKVYETVELTPEELTVTRVPPSGEPSRWNFNPYWVRLSLQARVGRSSELSIISHGTRLVFGSFLTDHEREEFAGVLKSALAEARNPNAA